MPSGIDAGMMSDPSLIPAWSEGVLRPVDKIEVHRLGLRHPAVSVFVFWQGRLLIQQRAESKYHTPGLWANTCCTHAHWGEDPLACAQRRLAEELGIKGLVPDARGQVEYRAEVGPDMIEHEVVDLFVAHCAAKPVLRPDPAEVMAARWVRPEALKAEIAAAPERFTPWLRIYLQDHAAKFMPRG